MNSKLNLIRPGVVNVYFKLSLVLFINIKFNFWGLRINHQNLSTFGAPHGQLIQTPDFQMNIWGSPKVLDDFFLQTHIYMYFIEGFC